MAKIVIKFLTSFWDFFKEQNILVVIRTKINVNICILSNIHISLFNCYRKKIKTAYKIQKQDHKNKTRHKVEPGVGLKIYALKS